MSVELFGEGKLAPLHLIRCAGELLVMYAVEVKTNIINALDDAEDVWGQNND